MQVESFQLCRSAMERGPYLDVVGIHDRIEVAHMPFDLPDCAIVASVRFTLAERGTRQFKIKFEDASHRQVMRPLNIPVQIQDDPKATGSIVRRFILRLKNLVLNAFGEYSINLIIDDRQVASMPFYVVPCAKTARR